MSKKSTSELSKPRRRSRKESAGIVEYAVLYGLSKRTHADMEAEDKIIDTCNQLIDEPGITLENKLRAIEASAGILAERVKIAGQISQQYSKDKKEKPAPLADYDEMMYG